MGLLDVPVPRICLYGIDDAASVYQVCTFDLPDHGAVYSCSQTRREAGDGPCGCGLTDK